MFALPTSTTLVPAQFHQRRQQQPLTRGSRVCRAAASASGLEEGVWIGQWQVSKLPEREMVAAAELQTEAFFQPGPIQPANDFFKYLMRGEQVDTLRSKLKYTKQNRFAALIARGPSQPSSSSSLTTTPSATAAAAAGYPQTPPSGPPGRQASRQIAGIVEISIQRNDDVAALLGFPAGSEYCYLACMAVAPDKRRGGAASSLLAAALLVAREWGFDYAALHVYVGNAPARALYERCGWTVRATDPTLPAALTGKKQRVLMTAVVPSLPPPSSAAEPPAAAAAGSLLL